MPRWAEDPAGIDIGESRANSPIAAGCAMKGAAANGHVS